MKTSLMILLCLGPALACRADLTLADGGVARCPIVVDPQASPAERNAAGELAAVLGQVTGARFSVQDASASLQGKAIHVGIGKVSRERFASVPFDSLGAEELVIVSGEAGLLLAGGRPRGTLYAVSRFLETQCGVRWWTPWASRIPAKSTLKVGGLDVREKPAFEQREPFWYPAFDAGWSWRNRVNGQSSKLTADLGDCLRYKGFVHTFYPLVPPEEHFAAHPEWYSLVKGRRTADRAQLCLTNPRLREFMVERVKRWLRESPEAGIISVSQNDWYGACECEACKRLDDAEGSHAATMLDLVNHIAERIEPEFPHVAVDTLAYQYTRKPPRTLRPRPNVIVRLCSIECNFRETLEHPSNSTFADDIRGWSRLCQRLYIWDYTTDFSHYLQPHPNWFVLDANLRFFRSNGVRGVFEQGAYQSHGSEFAELRAWVLAQLLWNPDLDGRQLIREFLEGYYGVEAAPHLARYLEVMHGASDGHKLTCFAKPEAPHLRLQPLAEAERLWAAAEAAAREPEHLERIQRGHLAVRYSWITRWPSLRKEATEAGIPWPLPESRRQVVDDWLAVAQGRPDKPWTRITLLNEGGLTPEKWARGF